MNTNKCDFIDYLEKIKQEYEALKSQLLKANNRIAELENENYKLKSQICSRSNPASPSNVLIYNNESTNKTCEFDSSFTVPETDEFNIAQDNISRSLDASTENIIDKNSIDPEDVISATPRPSLSSLALSAKKDRNKKHIKIKKTSLSDDDNDCSHLIKDELLFDGDETNLSIIKREIQTNEIDLASQQLLSPKKCLFGGLRNILDKNYQNDLGSMPSQSQAVVKSSDQTNIIDPIEKLIKKETKDNTNWHSKSILIVNKTKTPKKLPFSDGSSTSDKSDNVVPEKTKMPLKLSLSGIKRPHSTKRLKQSTLDFTSQNSTTLQFKQLGNKNNNNNNNNNSTLLSALIDPNETYCEDVTGLRPSKIRSNTNKENTCKLIVKQEPISPSRQPLHRKIIANNDINNKSSSRESISSMSTPSSGSSSVFAIPNDTDDIIIDVDESEEMLNEQLLTIDKIKNEELSKIRTEYRQQPITYTKKDKDKLPGFACADCLKWFEHVGKGLSDLEIQKRIDACSKHKTDQIDIPNTPDGFWIPYLPSTSQE